MARGGESARVPILWRAERGVEELVWFGLRQAIACTFPVAFFLVLALSQVAPVPGIARYDVILLATILLQVGLVASGFESWADVRVALRFHALGLVLELFKTHPAIGSWSYPEDGLAKLAGVPLYSGFMYAAVASYMIAAWRLLRLRFTGYPSSLPAWLLAAGVYVNFFTHHWLPDLRWWLLGATLWVFRHTTVWFRPRATERSMPMPVAFLLIGSFVWIAENVSTLLGAWAYPHQQAGWELVDWGKLSSWSLLVIVSFVIVGEVMRRRHGLEGSPPRRVRAAGWHDRGLARLLARR